MATIIKTTEEIGKMVNGGKILAGVMEELKKAAKPGVKTIELDKLAEKLILEAGCQISFRTVRDYKWTTCLCMNNVVVHGLPSEYELKETDLLGIDVGLIYQGLHLDMAETIIVGNPANLSNGTNLTNFLSTGKLALAKAIEQAKAGHRIGDISKAIEENIKGAGYSPVVNLVGHGVGRTLHEDPHIPGVLRKKIEETPEIVAGMTLAIEVIYNMGESDVSYLNDDGWTIATADGSLSATFERSIAILDNETIILTQSA